MNKQFKVKINQLMAAHCLPLVLAAVLPFNSYAQNTEASSPSTQEATAATTLPRIANRPQLRDEKNSVPFTRPSKSIPESRGAFETYSDAVTGTSLAIFGRDLFSDVPTTFAPFDGAPVNSDYVIGTGDELQIRGWGMVDINVSATVDRAGAIYIPRVGSVRVAGVAYRDLQGFLKNEVSKFFTNFELTVSVAQTRAVQVYVVGHAVRPGTYTLSSMSTLLNALFTSGGPSAAGSMRNIQLKRGGETVKSFDLYDVLVGGDKSKDIGLRDGDVIYIPEVGPLVALSGNVKKPSIFELKGTTSLRDLLNWAGGFDSASAGKEITIEKSINNRYETVLEVTAGMPQSEARLASIPVGPAEILRVFSPGALPVEVQNRSEYVRIAGEVKNSGVFQIRSGETLRELITRIGGPTDNGYIYAMKVFRDSLRRTQQAKLDAVADRFERELERSATERLNRTSDQANLAIISAEVERQRAIAAKLRMVKADGRIVLELQDGSASVKNLPDLQLQNGDNIYIPRRPGTVDVMGSVFQQGAFIYKPRRVARDYLELAGGVTASADQSEMYIIRADGSAESRKSKGWFVGFASTQINPGDTIVVPEEIEGSSWTQTLKEWTAIFYQFGLGAAGLKVLQN